MANELWFKGKQYSGVGKSTEGVSYTIGGQTYTGDTGAEIFNDYTGNKAVGAYAHAEGSATNAIGDYSHAEGISNSATASGAHAEGYNNTASGNYSHVEGSTNEATKQEAHAEGYQTKATGDYAHAEGAYTTASGQASHAEGYETEAQGKHSHAEGYQTITKDYGHAENYCTYAGLEAHAEGYRTRAQKDQSHSEGNCTVASGTAAHAEGINSRSFEAGAHAEGNHGDDFLVTLTSTDNPLIYTYTTTAIVGPRAGDIIVENGTGNIHKYKALITANNSTNNTITLNQTLGTKDAVEYIVSSNGAIGSGSHIEGYNTKAIGNYSHASGQQTVAMGLNQTVIGKNNIVDNNNTYAFIIGNGTNITNRSNAFAIDWNGAIYGIEATSFSMKSASSIAIDSGFKLKGTSGGEVTIGDMQNNKSIYISATGNTLSLNQGCNFLMNNGSRIDIQNGGQVNINEGSQITLYGSSKISLDDGIQIVGKEGNNSTTGSPKFDFTLSQIKPASTGTGSSVNVGTNVEISSEKFYIDNTVKQALQYNQGAGVLDKYKINFGDSLLIENYKLDYDSNNEYATTVDACQMISISKSAYITIVGGDSASSDQDTVISITRPKIIIEDCYLDLNDSRIKTSNDFDFYGNGGDCSLKSSAIDIDSGTVSIKENSKIGLSGGTSITGDSTKVSIKIGSNPAVDFTYNDLLKLKELIDNGPVIERTLGQAVGINNGPTNSIIGQAQEVNE